MSNRDEFPQKTKDALRLRAGKSVCERQAARERLAAGETQRAVARSYHVSASTISRLGVRLRAQPEVL